MKYVSIIALTAALSGCTPEEPKPNAVGTVGIANPASEYCVSVGGRVEIMTETDGQVGNCHLPDGSVVEEWALFRKNNT
ncbi:DUF333 domain-containing protein [Halocynthiibacter namhaensis]|uniref:putative hemolysin n=1 Tax=Halocynthiibacter namhaensis TaxID=1290553 RepID=UPI00057952D0|nr:DUF333 domain-containing protein [Halocynthiibacter namhaensis]